MVAAGVTVHYAFAALGQLPTERPSLQQMVGFAIDHTFFLNIGFGTVAAALLWLHFRGDGRAAHHAQADGGVSEGVRA